MLKQSKENIPFLWPQKEMKELNEVIRELVLISDVNGVAIVKADGKVVSWCTNNEKRLTQYIDYILSLISSNPQKQIYHYKIGVFTQTIIDLNNSKILLSRIRPDLIVMLMLNKSAYLGLAMLAMEGCLRELDEVLGERPL